MVVWLSTRKKGQTVPADFSTRRFGSGARRGQSILIDFVAALFIFVVLLAYFIILWDSFSGRYVSRAIQEGLETRAMAVADQLVESPGQPFNWTAAPASAQSVGLAATPNKLEQGRVDALASLPYANAKQVLGMDSDFLITIQDQNGTVYASVGQSPSNQTLVAQVLRYAILNGKTVSVTVETYAQ